MERSDADNWYLVRAGALFKQVLATLLPDVDVYQPRRLVARYNRRLRKKIRREELILPGYAFVRGVIDLSILRVTSEFHGLVRSAGEVVQLSHAKLEEFHTTIARPPEPTETPRLDEDFKVGQKVVLGSSSLFGGYTAIVLGVCRELMEISVMGPQKASMTIKVPRELLAAA